MKYGWGFILFSLPFAAFAHGDKMDAYRCSLKENKQILCEAPQDTRPEDLKFYRLNVPRGRFKILKQGASERACALRSDARLFCWGTQVPGPQGYTFYEKDRHDHWGARCPGVRDTHPTQLNGRFLDFQYTKEGLCALRTNHQVRCFAWPQKRDRICDHLQWDAPGFYKALSPDGWHLPCGITPDKKEVCWPEWSLGFPPDVKVIRRYDTLCGLSPTGQLECRAPDEALTRVPEGERFTKVRLGESQGHLFACGTTFDGHLLCWGGGVKRPPGVIYVAVGAQHSCGLLDSGQIVCWGNHAAGRATPPRIRKKVLSDISWEPAVLVAVGNVHSCAVHEDLSLVCWGDNTYGQLEVPSGTFIDLWIEGDTNYALRETGQQVRWGRTEPSAVVGWPVEALPSQAMKARPIR